MNTVNTYNMLEQELQLNPVETIHFDNALLIQDDINEWSIDNDDQAISGAACGCRCRA